MTGGCGKNGLTPLVVLLLSVALTDAATTTLPPGRSLPPGPQGACTWNLTPNAFVPGGTNDPAMNLYACQAACKAMQGCDSIDWNLNGTSGLQCFVHTRPAGGPPPPTGNNPPPPGNRTNTAQGVNHYDYKCPRAPQSPPLPVKTCQTNFELYLNTVSPGGYLVPDIKDADNCSTTAYRMESIVGYEYNPNTQECWLHDDSTDWMSSYSQAGGYQVRINKCPQDILYTCTPAKQYGILIDVCSTVCYPAIGFLCNLAGSGNQEVSDQTVGNATKCIDYCLEDNTDCIGVDYIEKPAESPRCVYYTTSQRDLFDNVSMAYYSTQYRLTNRCAKNCSTNFTRFDNTQYHLVNPQPIPGLFDEEECVALCRLSDTCQAVEFQKTSPAQCTIADNYYDGTQKPNSTVVTLLWTINCTEPPLPTTPVPRDRCVFYCSSNVNIYGGMVNPATTIYACMQVCRDSMPCKSIDFSPSNPAGQQCFLLNTQANKNNATGVVHCDLVCSASNGSNVSTQQYSSITTVLPLTSIPGSGGGCRWIPFQNTNIYGGAQNPATTLDGCKAACLQNITYCQSIDFVPTNPAGIQCYLLNTQAGKNPNSLGTTHYDYDCTNATNPASCFTQTPNTLIYSGTKSTTTTLSDCQTECLTMPSTTCSSIDWDTTSGTCYLHNTQQGKYTGNGVNHYDRKSNC